MTRKLKALGLALFAVMAMGAFSASMASAEFHSEAAHTIIDGKQPVENDDVFTVNAGTVKCTEASYSGTTESATTDQITVIPAYTGCTAFGFINSPIDVSNCHYLFTSKTKELHITATGTCKITVTAFNCHVSLTTQTLTGITYDNAGSGSSRDVTVTANVSGIKYTQESKSFPGCTNGTFTNGTYKGSGTVTGTNTTGGAVGVWNS